MCIFIVSYMYLPMIAYNTYIITCSDTLTLFLFGKNAVKVTSSPIIGLLMLGWTMKPAEVSRSVIARSKEK